MSHTSRSHPQWRIAILVCLVLAAALPPLARVVAGPAGANIHVEWKPSVDEPTRLRLEKEFRLADRRKLDDPYTWRYDLTDPSPRNIEALVTHPDVEDTHEIDRHTFTLSPTAPRTSRRHRFPGGEALVDAASGCMVICLLLAAVIAITRRSPVALAQRAVPDIDARTAGIFRIVFGIAVIAYFLNRRVDASWLNTTFDLEVEGWVHSTIMGWLHRHPAIVNGLTPWLLTMGAAFTAGLFTRITYPLFVAGAILWAYVAISISSTHPIAALMLALVALLPSRWGDALSLDAWRRRHSGHSAQTGTGKVYGYSVWVPGLVFGVTFAAAAWAKLTVPPGVTDWVLNGTVKYHFITDSVNAPVDWGLQLVRYPRLAIVVSFLAIATEGLALTAAFVRNQWYRLAIGAGIAALLTGFRLFMGVFWPGWWILLLGFLPWQWIQRLGATKPAAATSNGSGQSASPRIGALTAVQVALVAFVLAQQVVVSSMRLERAPMFSWYDMYSGTYASAEAWKATRPPAYRIVALTKQGSVALPQCNPHGEFVREFEHALDGSTEARRSVWAALRGCGDAVAQATAVTLEGHAQDFDWDTLTFTTQPTAVTLGPLAAEARASADTP